MSTINEEYHCEDCEHLNEEGIPADCLKGNGKVAFRHPVCSDFTLKKSQGSDKKEENTNEVT